MHFLPHDLQYSNIPLSQLPAYNTANFQSRVSIKRDMLFSHPELNLYQDEASHIPDDIEALSPLRKFLGKADYTFSRAMSKNPLPEYS